MIDQSLIQELFGKVISLKARDVKLGWGSFITMGFGNDMAYEITIRKKRQREHRPEWFFWVMMSFWRLVVNDETIAHCEDDRDYLREVLKVIENKSLLKVEVLSDKNDLQLSFEGGIILHLISNLEENEEDFKQWMLFTPERKTLVAAGYETLIYEPSGE